MMGYSDSMTLLKVGIIMLLKTVLLCTLCTALSYKPNIIIITADDIGYNDLGLMGGSDDPDVKSATLYLHQYASVSKVLKNYYVMPNGHSTRSALLTGKHPATLGTQFENNDGTKPYGLDSSERILPQYLSALGYRSHAVGQWDLGFYSDDLLPTNRGYDSFYGSYLSYGDYLTHRAKDSMGHEGLDLHTNRDLDKSEDQSFKTELYARKAEEIIRSHNYESPLHLYVALQGAQAKSQEGCDYIPNDYSRKISRNLDPTRRCHLALVAAVDRAYGRIMQALNQRLVLKNSIVIFTTTSGGPAAGQQNFNAASNSPLRGAKSTGWEGAVRGVSMVYYPRGESVTQRTSDCLFHVTDWIPTLISMYDEAGESSSRTVLRPTSSMYGVDQFNCLYTEGTSNRDSIVHFAYGNSASVMIQQRYKLVVNTDGHLAQMDEWYSQSSSSPIRCAGSNGIACDPSIKACMFDLQSDPCEQKNIAEDVSNEYTLNELWAAMQNFNSSSVKYTTPVSADYRGDPANFGYAWQPWISAANKASTHSISLAITSLSIVISVLLSCFGAIS